MVKTVYLLPAYEAEALLAGEYGLAQRVAAPYEKLELAKLRRRLGKSKLGKIL